MVSSTGSGQIYNYHKILGKEDDIKQLSDDINDFNARYRVGSSNPTSALDGGDLFFNTTTGKLLVYNNTNTAWEEAQSIGNFFISTLSLLLMDLDKTLLNLMHLLMHNKLYLALTV